MLAEIGLSEVLGFLFKGWPFVLSFVLGMAFVLPVLKALAGNAETLKATLESAIKANEDKKVTQAEYDDFMNKANAFIVSLSVTRSAFGELFNYYFKKGKVMKVIILFMCLGMVFLGGCLWADSNTKMVLQSESAVIQELNRRCQDGNDCNLCKQGLKKAAEYADKVVTLSNGGKKAGE